MLSHWTNALAHVSLYTHGRDIGLLRSSDVVDPRLPDGCGGNRHPVMDPTTALAPNATRTVCQGPVIDRR